MSAIRSQALRIRLQTFEYLNGKKEQNRNVFIESRKNELFAEPKSPTHAFPMISHSTNRFVDVLLNTCIFIIHLSGAMLYCRTDFFDLCFACTLQFWIEIDVLTLLE